LVYSWRAETVLKLSHRRNIFAKFPHAAHAGFVRRRHSLHFTIRSRSFQPSPVEGVPPRSPNLDFGCHFESAGGLLRFPKVEINNPSKISMGYMEQFEAELLKKLESATPTAEIVRWASERVLESYRNGIQAGQKGVQVIRSGKSRRRDIFGNRK
jgi:hypothetical protein